MATIRTCPSCGWKTSRSDHVCVGADRRVDDDSASRPVDGAVIRRRAGFLTKYGS